MVTTSQRFPSIQHLLDHDKGSRPLVKNGNFEVLRHPNAKTCAESESEIDFPIAQISFEVIATFVDHGHGTNYSFCNFCLIFREKGALMSPALFFGVC